MTEKQLDIRYLCRLVRVVIYPERQRIAIEVITDDEERIALELTVEQLNALSEQIHEVQRDHIQQGPLH